MESDLQNQRIGSNFVSDVKRGQSTSETSKMTLPEKSVVSTSSEPTTADTTYTHRTAPRPRSIPPSPHDDDRTPRVRPRFSPPAARVHTGPRFSRRRDVPHRRRDAHACGQVTTDTNLGKTLDDTMHKAERAREDVWFREHDLVNLRELYKKAQDAGEAHGGRGREDRRGGTERTRTARRRQTRPSNHGATHRLETPPLNT